MAARAGAVIADAEFVQFHPTALDVGRDPAPLATEALRGEGAT
jgi:L-aspartate oxidase